MTNADIASPKVHAPIWQMGFRPFFAAASLWAVLSVLLWLAMMAGVLTLPTALDPASWHAHAFLFGYLSAVLSGFALTAIPNWTGQAPLSGAPLIALFICWVSARVAVAFSGHLPLLLVALIDLLTPIAVCAYIGRSLLQSGNVKNTPILVLFLLFGLSNAMFYWDVASGTYPAQGPGVHLGLATVIMMISVIGGRIVPTFTANWLRARKATHLPPAPMQPFDIAALLCLLIALITWLMAPQSTATAIALTVAGVLHLARLLRWRGWETKSEALLWVLHAGYAFVPLGAFAMAAQILWPDIISSAAAQHVWMAGAIGLMTLAVMSRAILGHTGRALHAGPLTILVYLCLIISVMTRILAGIIPDIAHQMHMIAGLSWLGAFGLFTCLYAPICFQPRLDSTA